MTTAYAHLHLPRFKAGEVDMISLKFPGEPIEYAASVVMSYVEFKVHEAGRQRTINEHTRNVHAWLVGQVVTWARGRAETAPMGWRKAVYDPFKGPYFVDAKTLKPVHKAYHARLVGKEVFYLA